MDKHKGSSKAGNLLIVEDNVTQALVLKKQLEEICNLIIVNSGEDAIVSAMIYPQPHVILLDMLLPGMDGIETCERLKKEEKTEGIPIIIYSAKDDKLFRERAIQAKAIDYIIKDDDAFGVVKAKIMNHITARKNYLELMKAKQDNEHSFKRSLSLEQELFFAHRTNSLGELASAFIHDYGNLLSTNKANIEQNAYLLETEASDIKQLLDDIRGGCMNEKGIEGILSGISNKLLRIQMLVTQLTSGSETVSKRGSDLKKQFQVYSKKGEPNLQETDINSVLNGISDLVRGGKNGVTECYDSEQLVYVDKGQMQQVFSNILYNAVHAMKEPGLIKIHTEDLYLTEPKQGIYQNIPKGNYVHVLISDTGGGISEEHLSRIFDSRYTTKPEGSGFGLSIVNRILNMNKIYKDIVTKVGKGTEFHLYFSVDNK